MEEKIEILSKSISMEKNMNENLDKNKKVRNPGIDFIRILAMYGIIINHIIYQEKTLSKFKPFKQFKKLKLLHILLFWHNNGFAFISGFIGYKKHKYSNLFYLWSSVFFYSIVIHLFYLKYKPQIIINDKFYYNLFPIIFNRYWFFTAYFGMYLFLPIINKGIAYLTKSELKICFISLLIIFVFWHDIMNLDNDIFFINKGFSVLWLLIFYISGAYFGKYKTKFFETKQFYYFLINFLIYVFTSILYYIIYNYETNSLNIDIKLRIIIILKHVLTENYDSNLKVIQSISVISFMSQINKLILLIFLYFSF
jgi:surface polysaccharide O-acyltransferase-like enzyme